MLGKVVRAAGSICCLGKMLSTIQIITQQQLITLMTGLILFFLTSPFLIMLMSLADFLQF